jgi:hypothetical protein
MNLGLCINKCFLSVIGINNMAAISVMSACAIDVFWAPIKRDARPFHNPGYPVKEPSLEALCSEPLQRERCPIPRAPFIRLSKFPVDQPPSLGPPTGHLYGEIPFPEPSSTHKPLGYEPSSRFPSEAPMERGTHLQSLLLHLQVPLAELP